MSDVTPTSMTDARFILSPRLTMTSNISPSGWRRTICHASSSILCNAHDGHNRSDAHKRENCQHEDGLDAGLVSTSHSRLWLGSVQLVVDFLCEGVRLLARNRCRYRRPLIRHLRSSHSTQVCQAAGRRVAATTGQPLTPPASARSRRRRSAPTPSPLCLV